MHPRRSGSKKHTARPTRLLRAFAWLTLAALAGCASGPVAPHRPADPAPDARYGSEPEWSGGQLERLERLREALSGPPEEPGGLSVRLAFDGAVDLDLFVTDPLQESVYFANTPSKTGGQLIADRRCNDPDLRVETIHFRAPPAGRYRVGVDFHRRCSESEYTGSEQKQGVYHVRVDHAGHSWTREGLLVPGRFEVIVLEVDLETPVGEER
jgi:hypothetical protein